jgi:hypothetical protein
MLDRLGLPDENARPPIPSQPAFSPREAPTLRRARVPKIRSVTEIITVSALTFVLGAVLGGTTVTLFQSRSLGQSAEFGVERAILDEARKALARKEPAAVMSSVGLHEREFAQGQLSEEREALRIHAALLTGKLSSARTLYDEFVKRYPDSLFAFGLQTKLEPGHLSGGGH